MFMRMKLLTVQCLSMEVGESLGHNLLVIVIGILLGFGCPRIDTLIDNVELYLHNTIIISLGVFMMR